MKFSIFGRLPCSDAVVKTTQWQLPQQKLLEHYKINSWVILFHFADLIQYMSTNIFDKKKLLVYFDNHFHPSNLIINKTRAN